MAANRCNDISMRSFDRKLAKVHPAEMREALMDW